jgi:RimJ/RimL family protein N-acetyltransferase
MFGPILRGPKIHLAPPQPAYLATYVRWFADPMVTRYLSTRNTPSLKQEEEWYERMAGAQDHIVWAILLNEEGTLIGNTGLHNIDWRHRHAESGIMIGETAQWGKGYASEAMRLRTAYAFAELGLEKVMTRVYDDNHASRRALEKAGYRQCGMLRHHRYSGGKWHDEWLGEILREEWVE